MATIKDLPMEMTNTKDGYLLDAKWIKGGYSSIENLSDLADTAIKKGSIIYYANSYYTWDGIQWTKEIISQDLLKNNTDYIIEDVIGLSYSILTATFGTNGDYKTKLSTQISSAHWVENSDYQNNGTDQTQIKNQSQALKIHALKDSQLKLELHTYQGICQIKLNNETIYIDVHEGSVTAASGATDPNIIGTATVANQKLTYTSPKLGYEQDIEFGRKDTNSFYIFSLSILGDTIENSLYKQLTDGTITVKNATNATHATSADSASTASTAGSATAAGKLSVTDIGSTTQPVYFVGGVPKLCDAYSTASMATGDSQGEIKYNGNNYSVNGLGATSSPEFSKVTAGSFVARSDIRLKENIKPFEYKQSILDLPIYTYDYKNNGAKNNIGCIAQDLQKIYPNLVYENFDGYLGVNESKLVYLLLEEIKLLKNEVIELNKKIKK